MNHISHIISTLLRVLIISFFISARWFGFSQDSSSGRNSIFLELAGSGGFGSINFERSFLSQPAVELTFRGGLSIAPIDPNNGFGIVFPMMVNCIIGKKSHKLEVGLGQGITVSTRLQGFSRTTACLGYRWQKESGKWFYRVSYTPLISYLVDFQWQHWAGLSIGYTLNRKKE